MARLRNHVSRCFTYNFMAVKQIEIHANEDLSRESRVYFKRRNGKYAFVEHSDPQSLLNIRQKESFFLAERSQYKFRVPESVITELEELLMKKLKG